jgi:hypothetical protein
MTDRTDRDIEADLDSNERPGTPINDPSEAPTENEYIDKLAEAGLIVDDRTERPGTPARRSFGGMAGGPMPAADRAWIEQETRRRSMIWPPNVQASTEAQILEAAALAIDLYETAASYGIARGTADGVTSFIDSAIDVIRARDRRP